MGRKVWLKDIWALESDGRGNHHIPIDWISLHKGGLSKRKLQKGTFLDEPPHLVKY
jgi:hypothetical protein